MAAEPVITRRIGVNATRDCTTVIGAMIRERREAWAMSQSELARRTKLVPSHISRIESGEREPSRDMLTAIGLVLDIEIGLLCIAAGYLPGPVSSQIERGALTPEQVRAALICGLLQGRTMDHD